MNDNNAIFSGKYIYLDTNNLTKITYNITRPLTSAEVKKQIDAGNYVLFLWNKMTTYKIGNNLYIPRYGSYIYIGDTNSSGSILYFKTTYYRLKFKIK